MQMDSQPGGMVASCDKSGNRYLTRKRGKSVRRLVRDSPFHQNHPLEQWSGGRPRPPKALPPGTLWQHEKSHQPKLVAEAVKKDPIRLELEAHAEFDLPLRTQRVHAGSVAYPELVQRVILGAGSVDGTTSGTEQYP